ncbi:glycosyl transferase family 2 [Winogradskyella pacifica]|uniref:Glycosyl transferase family 2 n=1 Tax=Winogradskyella pacifica TaxID=664642 RepID=A0A3D9MYY1_9FLAO|nr:glycosyltransferase family 2 protein [Winogradskyella pacifica]REE24459.1 glycosyl transferase family 2 [Winogradskyella pacifica]
MKTALVLTVKNEKRLLRDNLLYHRALGAHRIFVYFDGTTDDGKASIEDLDFVTIQDSVSGDVYAHLSYLEKFTKNAVEHHTARQCLNTYDAIQHCKKEGVEWLISLDADELVCLDFNQKQSFAEFFDTISKDTAIVNFKVFEVLQRKLYYNNVLEEETLFKTTSSFKNRFKAVKKSVFNPFTKEHQSFCYWYGQHLGKAALRVSNDIIPKNVHRYKTISGAPLKNVTRLGLLHYHAYDAEDFIKKFKNFKKRANTYLSGNTVDVLKLLLRDVVNQPSISPKDLEDYFKHYIMFSPKEVRRLLKNRWGYLFRYKPALIQKITSVREVFKNIERINKT